MTHRTDRGGLTSPPLAIVVALIVVGWNDGARADVITHHGSSCL